MKIHDTALKHGIDPEDIMRAAAWPLWIEDLDDDSPARQLRLGFERRDACWRPWWSRALWTPYQRARRESFELRVAHNCSTGLV